jgi:hypothetical protein
MKACGAQLTISKTKWLLLRRNYLTWVKSPHKSPHKSSRKIPAEKFSQKFSRKSLRKSSHKSPHLAPEIGAEIPSRVKSFRLFAVGGGDMVSPRTERVRVGSEIGSENEELQKCINERNSKAVRWLIA